MKKQKERAYASKIVSAKENFKLSYGWPSQGQALGTNQRFNTFAAKHLKKPIPRCQACLKDS